MKPELKFRKYDREKDFNAVVRIWRETGWIIDDNTKHLEYLLETDSGLVADIGKEPECLAISTAGDMDYLGRRIPFALIACVTTSLIARQKSLASRLTAERIALDVQEGAAVSGLGIFDQGYYDRLGYGTGSYDHYVDFTPSTLNIDLKSRVPRRLTNDDWQLIHRGKLNRLRTHGSCSLSEHQSKHEYHADKKGYGYGYTDNKGELTHFFWAHGKGEAPMHLHQPVFRNLDQFRELLALIKSFGEQVKIATMVEPPNVQMQDFINKPIHYRTITSNSKFQNTIRAFAFWQMRICDLEACLEITSLPGTPVSFNLVLDDPITQYLNDTTKWQGISGDYTVTLGPESSAVPGHQKNLPVMNASVGAFTRMWLGVLPSSTLAVSDQLEAPPELLTRLDGLLQLPSPRPDWEF